jgi:hypothetical protein
MVGPSCPLFVTTSVSARDLNSTVDRNWLGIDISHITSIISHKLKRTTEPTNHLLVNHYKLTVSCARLKRSMSQIVFAGAVLLVVTYMVWPISSRSRWNPSGRVCVSLLTTLNVADVGLALLRYRGLKWSWPRTSSSSYEARC